MEIYTLFTAEYYDEPYQVVNTPNIEDILTFDLTLGIQDSDGVWSLALWSKNITDEEVIFAETVEEQGDPEELIGYSANPRAPRSFGVTLNYRFGPY